MKMPMYVIGSNMLDTLYNFFIFPIDEYEFMQKAIVSLLILSLISPITGIFLVLRKLSLSGDAISHAILPGAAIGFLLFGLSVFAITICSLIAGIIVIASSAIFSRISKNPEDSSLAVFYLLSLALGVLIISISGSNLDLLHFLFGSIFAITDEILITLATITIFCLFVLAIIIRPLIIDSMDPLFLTSVSKAGPFVHLAFMVITVMNLVASFQAIGTLMAVGLMIIPATIAKFWSYKLNIIILIAVIVTMISVYIGVLLSFHFNYPSSPCIILILVFWYLVSFIFGINNGVIWNFIKTKHLEA